MLVAAESEPTTVLLLATAKIDETVVVIGDGAAEEGLSPAPLSPIRTQPDLAMIAAGQLTFSQLTLQELLAHRL